MSDVSLLTILPGRHQPPHFDHLRLISAVLERRPGELYVGLIVSPPAHGAPASDFEREARLHQQAERAPFSFDLRRRLLEAALAEHLAPSERARVHVIALPRPEAHFELIEALFPERRVWVVPEVGEAFDELKARYFVERGDEVLRVPMQSRVSGQTVRALIQAEAWRQLETHVPRSVIRILREERTRRQET